MHRQSELEAIKTSEENAPVSEQVRKARAEAERLLGVKYFKIAKEIRKC